MNLRLPLRPLKIWLRDDIINRVFRNVAYLFSANVLTAVIGLASLTLIARALGPEALGILVLAEAYVRMIDLLVRPEPWHAVIKYGAELLEEKRSEDFKRLIKFGTLLDVAGGMLGTAVAATVAWFAGRFFGWDHGTVLVATIYSFGTLFSLDATPIGILRLFDRFTALATMTIVLALVRFVMVVIGFALGGDLWMFLAIFMTARSMEHLVPVVMGWRELRRRGYGDALKVSLRGVLAQNPKLWRFIWSANLSLSFRSSTQYLDTLLVGGLIDATAVGLYHVAKRIGLVVLKIGQPIQQAIYPELARLWAQGETARFRKSVFQINAGIGFTACLGLVIMILEGETIIRLILGDRFAQGTLLTILQMVAATLFLFGVCSRPALLSMGRHREVLTIAIGSSVAFFAFMLASVPLIGVVGASLAHVAHNLLWLILTLRVILSTIPKTAPAAKLLVTEPHYPSSHP